MSDFDVIDRNQARKLAELEKLYRIACRVWATNGVHTEMHRIAVRDLCELVDRMQESRLHDGN